MIQKLSNYYNYCLFRLIGYQARVQYTSEFNIVNNDLSKYGIMNFKHRLLEKLLIFSHKIVNSLNGPLNLKSNLVKNSNLNKTYLLRNNHELAYPKLSKLNNYGEQTFSYFFIRLINNLCINDIDLDLRLFKFRINNNINLIFNDFVILFGNFDLDFKIFYLC